MSVGIEKTAPELSGSVGTSGEFHQRLEDWENLMVLLVDPNSTQVTDRPRKQRLLSFLLKRADIDEKRFWNMTRGQRGRLFLSRYSRLSRDIPQLEITSFDIDKAVKERFRNEPLTLGAAWHYGFWRSYFSHAAITHPANDGLREEFSTVWDIARRSPAVLFRTDAGTQLEALRNLRLDMPMIIGPLPHSDGYTLERAYLRAIERADPLADRKTRTLVVIEGDRLLEHQAELLTGAPWILPRLTSKHLEETSADLDSGLDAILSRVRICELEWSPKTPEQIAKLRANYPELLFSVFIRNGPDFWEALDEAVAIDGVAMIQVHAGSEKSYRLIPRVDSHLKRNLMRARIQLVNVGGDSDTQASAATVYESVLLGANGGAMTHIASLALVPELIDTYHGSKVDPIIAGLAGRDPDELRVQAENTLSCWQHSILEFLSCMGIDDIMKTSGNTMAITVTEDWMEEVDALATEGFGKQNQLLNDRRVASETIPEDVRERFSVTALLEHVERDLPMVQSAKILAQESASWHLMNSNRNLTADFLEVIYRMSAGELPRADEFFLKGDMGLGSIDEVGTCISQESLQWAVDRLHRDPALLNYISLAVPRGFLRPGAVPARTHVELRSSKDGVLASFDADAEGGFDLRFDGEAPQDGDCLSLVARDGHTGALHEVELLNEGHNAHGRSVLRASKNGAAVLKRDPRGGLRISGLGIREPIWHGPVCHASISLGAASEDFLTARIEGSSGIAFTSSGEGGPIRLADEKHMAWQSLQAASGHFGIQASDLRRVRDVEIKINQGAKPGKGGRLSGAKVTPQVSRARNIPVGTNALSPDPKHDIYSIEDMPAEVWLWLLYHNHCGIKITGSNYTRYVAAGMWSNFVVDYLLIDSGLGGSGNYHADSSHVGWPDIFRTILHTHHALVNEMVDLDNSGELHALRDLNGAPFGALGGTRLFASGGLRGEFDMLRVLIAGADAVVTASIDKAVAFGCNQCGNCHLDCPRGGITTKPELTIQNERALMTRRMRNWSALNLVKLAVLIDAINRERGALDESGEIVDPDECIRDVRQLRGRTDLLTMPARDKETPAPKTQDERDSCRVGSMAVSEPVSVEAIWESARVSHNGGNNRGGGIDFAGFAPQALRERTCMMFNTIGPDRRETMSRMLGHLDGCQFLDAEAQVISVEEVQRRLDEFRVPVREKYAAKNGWKLAGLRENVGDFYTFFLQLRPEVRARYGKTLLASKHWLQRQTKYGDLHQVTLELALDEGVQAAASKASLGDESQLEERLEAFLVDVREEYFSALGHILDSRYYRTQDTQGAPENKYADKRRGYVVSMGEDLGALKISGWAHTIPEYFNLDRFWAQYPGAKEKGGIEVVRHGQLRRTTKLLANVWGMHHRYPTNSPSVDAEGRGNPAGAHPFKAYNVLLKHNGEQVGVDSTAPFLCEYGYVHSDESMGADASLYQGDSVYERKALTDTEYAAYLVDFTRRVLGLTTEEASQIISPITGIDLEAMEETRREKLRLLMQNYVQLTPTGPYKFTIVESKRRDGQRIVGFRENMDIKFLRPHEIVSHRDMSAGGVEAVANGSEAKIADSMLRVLHREGVLKDSSADLRFNMRSGGKPGLEEHGGVFEAFVTPGDPQLHLVNRFGELVPVRRAGFRADLSAPLEQVERLADLLWMEHADELVDNAAAEAQLSRDARSYGPEDALPPAALHLIDSVLEQVAQLSFHDYRYLVERSLTRIAKSSDSGRALALRILTELRKRLIFTDLGHKALSSVEYLTDGGHDSSGRAEGGIYRLLDDVPHLADAHGNSQYLRICAATRDDLIGPVHAATDVLVIDMFGFESESFTLESSSRFVSECVRHGWRHIVGYNARGGPRYIGTNMAGSDGQSAQGVSIELYGREQGDFLGALLEGARIYLYGQAQSHVGFKADSGHLFVLQDALNTCMYAAHGATFSAWDSGSRFAVAGQNKPLLADGVSVAQGFKSIHIGTPNEYAFEYLMSGGSNSLHVVLGLKKPDNRGELSVRPKPYAGKFLMSGAAAGRVILFDPKKNLDPAQHLGNVKSDISPEEWADEIAPLIAEDAKRRGMPIRIDGESFSIRLEGNWRSMHYSIAFVKLVPGKTAAVQRAKEVATSGSAKA